MNPSDQPPPWPPTTEPALSAAATNGVLTETHTLDIKQELPQGPSGTRGIAKDIAAFSLDGGTIVIGVDETTSPPSLTPVPLDGLAERIEQIAATAVDEPALITTTVIESQRNPALGYVLVSVPASPRAPLMADGKYYGRGDKTNRVLPHAEVLRLHERQLVGRKSAIEKAHEHLAAIREECPNESPEMMLVLAEPLGAPEDLLLPLSDDGVWQSSVFQLAQQAASADLHQYSPTLAGASGFDRRPGGVALTTGMHAGRFAGIGSAAELVLFESGAIYVASNRTILAGRRDERNIFETMIIGHTKLLARLCALVADRYRFTGSWRFGLVVTGIRGADSAARSHQIMAEHGTPYGSDVYEASTAASLVELARSPNDAVGALVGKLLRSLGSQQWVQV